MTVDEVPVLARALGVPPVLLLLPLGVEPTVEMLEGHTMPTWLAVKWFTGAGPFPTRTDDGPWVTTVEDRKAWETSSAPLNVFLDHEQRVKDIGDLLWPRDVDPFDMSAETALVLKAWGDFEPGREKAQNAVTRLRDLRQSMRRSGIEPPELPGHLAYIDEKGS